MEIHCETWQCECKKENWLQTAKKKCIKAKKNEMNIFCKRKQKNSK